MKRSMFWVVFAAAVMLGVALPAMAATTDDADQVTVQVDPVLGISDEQGNFSLVFDSATGSAAGAISLGQTVTYNVQANAMPNTALVGALSAKVSALIGGITLKAFPGDYINDGTASNAVLSKVGDDVAIGTTAAAVYDKPASSGAEGKVLNGRAPIHYRAIADRDLTSTDGGTVTLTVTLKDA